VSIIEEMRPEIAPLDAEWSRATLNQILGQPASPRHQSNRRLRLAGAVAAAAAGVASILGLTSLGASPAFAVSEANNGDVIIDIYRLTDAAALENALGQHGVNANVTYLVTQVPSDLSDGSEATPCSDGQTVGAAVQPEEGGWEITLKRAYLDSHAGAQASMTVAGGRTSDERGGLKIEWSDGRC